MKTFILVIVFLLLAVGCAQLPATSQTPDVPPPTPTLSTTATETLPASTVSSRDTTAEVIRVIDGDTIEVSINGQTYTVRYIGIDTPETVHPDKPVQAFGIEASNKNKELVAGKTVQLEKDVSEADRYGRLLRYVYVGDLLVNAELVRLGYAQVTTYPPDVKFAGLFLRLQQEARDAGRGLWATSPTTSSQTSQPNVALPLRVVSVTSPVKAGNKATLIAETTPGATVSITVYYKSGPSSAAGLESKLADSSGRVSWTWTVGSRTTPGIWRIVVATGPVSTETTFSVQ